MNSFDVAAIPAGLPAQEKTEIHKSIFHDFTCWKNYLDLLQLSTDGAEKVAPRCLLCKSQTLKSS